MEKNKRGQFYLIAILIIIAIFVGFITVANYIRQDTNVDIRGLEEEIQIERRNVLDYVFSNPLSDTQINSIFTNFSEEFIKKIGDDKDIIFIFGKPTSIQLVGNQLEDTLISYNVGESFVNLKKGEFKIDLIVSINPIVLEIDGNQYSFELLDGQNIYYLIKYNYNEEVYIING